MKKANLKIVLCLSVLVASFVSSCKKDKAEDEVAPETSTVLVGSSDARVTHDWQNTFLEIERYAAVYRPCPTAHMLGYVGLGAYEACVPGMPAYKSLTPLYAGLNIPSQETSLEYHYPSVLNAYYASIYKKFFATVRAPDKTKIDSLRTALETVYASAASQEVIDRSEAYGNSVADAIWAYENTDIAGHDQYLDPRPLSYAPPVGTGLWVPTPPGNQAAMFPYWGQVRAFAITGAEKTCRPPLPYSTDQLSPYYAQGLEVYALTTPQTAEHQWIAEFWSDDVLGFTFSPPARWIAITNEVLDEQHSNLETAVLAGVKVGLALNDAAIGCWNSKYIYNVERPATYIVNVMGKNTWNVAALTSTHFVSSTPSFPAYPSGHSTFGGAAAEALSSVFGFSYHMTDRCHQNRTDFNGAPRSFSSFYEMAEENAYSRLYLGVHWRMDCEEGLRYGYEIGRKVENLPFKK